MVDYNSDDEINSGDSSLANQYRTSVVLWILHLGCDGEERWSPGEGEDDHGDGRHKFRESGISYGFDIGSEWSSLWSSCWTVLNAD